MTNFPGSIESKLGVDQIREWVAARCTSEQGRQWAYQAKTSVKTPEIGLWLAQTGEFMYLIQSGDLPNRRFQDLLPFLTAVKVNGTFLEPSDYLEVANLVASGATWLLFLTEKKDTYPALNRLTGDTSLDTSICDQIRKTIDEQGEVRDSATPELAAIRARLHEAERAARAAVARILKKCISDAASAEDSQVTIRDGRLVIPVKAEYKRRIPGLLHDESATGQTVYLEPAEALELNNEVRELKNRERREIVRILTSIADNLRAQLPMLILTAKLLGRLDFIHAKASWGLDFRCAVPQLSANPELNLVEGRHPILWHNHTQSQKPVVPLNLHLDQSMRLLVISGPNAGGKSVVLKTVGLLQYLVQMGFPVPADERSVFGTFRQLFLDIGDTQSIEDDLSTYSAHLSAMRHFLRHADASSLILIDEFGKGTEPQFGGAIAEAILEQLNHTACFGVVTTHYQNLKDLAEHSPGMANGAMKYDINRLEPLFVLDVGKPGSSFAFEIAGKMGLPREVISSARGKVGQGQMDYEKSIAALEKERLRYQKLADKSLREEKDLQKFRKDYEELSGLIKEERKQVINEAKREAKRLLDDANKLIEKTIREIREHQADKEKTKALREAMQAKGDSLQLTPDKKPVKKRDQIEVGDRVRMTGHDGVGEVMRLKGKEAEVQFGLMKSFVSLERLERVGARAGSRTTEKVRTSVKGLNMVQKQAEFDPRFSMLGMRAEEALPAIDAFIDQAILLGAPELKIVHGKGHGVLRELVRNHLKGHPGILRIEDEHADRGGSGISVVTMR
jgi:DNA mismatch repair protein MutS2